MIKQSKISVWHLVEFILRRGSIDNRRENSHTVLEGARIRRKLQRDTGESYEKEVFLKTTVQLDKYYLIVESCAGGTLKRDGIYYIDKIKTSEPRFEDLEPEQVELFFHQARMYAYIYSQEHDLQEINLQLTYFQTAEEIIMREVEHQAREQLETFFKKLTEDYREWFVFRESWRTICNASLMALKFPHNEYRKGQRELAVAAYKTIRTKRKLLVEAPTGTERTISTLFPTLKVVGEEEGGKISYLTARTVTRQVAEDAMAALKDTGAEVKSVTLTAKDKICFLDEMICNPGQCPYVNGYCSRTNEDLWDFLSHENQITREIIETYARKHTLCPFELSLDVGIWYDVIIGDYNYLFDPTVYLKCFFEDEENEGYLLLIDEAHNLVNRSRETYSTELSYEKTKRSKEAIPKKFKELRRRFNKLLKKFNSTREIAKEDHWDYHHQKAPTEPLVKTGYQLSKKIREWLAEFPKHPSQEQLLPYYFDLLHFLKVSEFYDGHYKTIIEKTYRGLIVKEPCIDPSSSLEQSLDKGESSILLSASFSPLSCYQGTLGGQRSLAYKLPSPLPEGNQQIFIANYLETTYRKREHSLARLVEMIRAFTDGKVRNYLVFSPSYQHLDLAVEAFRQHYPDSNAPVQETDMNEGEHGRFLTKFQTNPTEALIGFCVLGGVFSEGIDLGGGRLTGGMIVGVGLPQMNHEQELIKSYYDKKGHFGFAYTYQLPGMNKVLQVGGRVTRGMADQEIVVLADQRFPNFSYRCLFPQHWQTTKEVRSVGELEEGIQRFWLSKEAVNQKNEERQALASFFD